MFTECKPFDLCSEYIVYIEISSTTIFCHEYYTNNLQKKYNESTPPDSSNKLLSKKGQCDR